MKKILYLITQAELGGAQVYIKDLAIHFKNTHEIVIASGEQTDDSWLKRECSKNDIKFIALKHVKREICPSQDLLAVFEIRKIIKKEKPDIIHLNSSKISILGSIANIKLRSKVIYTIHGWVFNEILSNFKKSFYISIEKITAKLKDHLICVSEHDYKTAIDKKICPKNKLTIVHNGINLKYSLSKNDARLKLSSLKPEAEINENDFLLGSIGNLYKNKGYEFLLGATKILLDNGINIKQIIIGTGEEKENLEDEISQLRLKKDIFIISDIEKASQYLKAFDVYVCSSIKEGLSYTIIEAMLSELPIIATKVGGNGELISDKETGILTKSKNSKDLAKAILKLKNNPELAKKLASNAKIKAQNDFSLEQMIKKTNKIYNNFN